MGSTLQALRQWNWFKKSLFFIALFTFLASSFLFLTPPGGWIRTKLAETVITTQHRDWAWIFVGAEQRDLMVKHMQDAIEEAAKEKQDLNMIRIGQHKSMNELIKVEDISGQLWKGKKMYVYDPKSIRIMTPSKVGEGEKITSMVQRTGAVAGVNGGGFNDPEGLGNGFAAIGAILSGGDVIFTDQDGSIPQHIVGFTKEGKLVIGKYNIFELRDMGVSEGVSFYPRLIANGKPLITSGDGGWGRAPRTAVGQKADGTVIFIVIDGRQSHSVGATMKEVQDLFLEEGVINAGNLDGGASSEMVVDGELVTKPSSRYGERRLPSAFLVYENPNAVKADRIWDGVDKIDAGGSYDHPDFLKEQAERKAKGLPSQTTTTPTTTNTTTPAKPKTTEPAKTTETKSTETKTPAGKTDAKSDGGKTESAKPGTSEETTPGGTSGSTGGAAGKTQDKGASGSDKPAGSQTPATSESTGHHSGTGGSTSVVPSTGTSGNGAKAPETPASGNTGAAGTAGSGSTAPTAGQTKTPPVETPKASGTGTGTAQQPAAGSSGAGTTTEATPAASTKTP